MCSLSAEEKAAFEQYMQEDSFKKEVELYASIFSVSEQLEPTPAFDHSIAWAQMEAELIPMRTAMWSRRAWLGAAASVVLIMLSWLIFRSPQSDPNTGLSLLAQDNAQVHELNDGSVVYLQAGSELSINDGFDQVDRKLELNGTACFQVAPLKNFPFTVISGEAIVTVTGTRFTLSPDQLLVSEGRVELKNANQDFRLNAGEMVDLRTNELLSEVEAESATWIQGAMEFNNVSLKHIIEQAEQFYKTRIRINDSRLDERFTLSLAGLTLDQALNVLSKLTNTRISKDSQGYILE